MKFKCINEALDWIMAQRRNGSEFNKFKKVIEELDNPQDKFKMIHVAGTNGKGSTITYIRDILMMNGYKVGTMQSPHYLTHLDRIRINNQNIPDEVFLRILNQNVDYYIQKELNMFEMDYLIMCQYFLEEDVDFAIVEVGMGGRLDSTNVVNRPILSIITTIGYDHMKELGDTLEKICIEKCGIIKNNCPVLIGDLEDNLKLIVKNIAEERNSEYLVLDDYTYIKPTLFKYHNERYEISSYAKYQVHNASLALKAIDYLKDYHYIKYDIGQIKKALKISLWKGRFEIVNDEPMVIVDGAHNIEAIKALVDSLKDIKLTKGILFSAINTKEYAKMLNLLMEYGDELVITSFDHPLIIDGKKLANEFNIQYIKDNTKAYNYLKDRYQCIIVCGSLYFLSEMISKGEICKKIK